MKKIFLLLIAIAFAGGMMAQNVIFLNLDATTHGSTEVGPGNSGMAIYDDGGAGGNYSHGHDYWMTIQSDCAIVDTSGKSYLGLTIAAMDISCQDTFYIYDGPTTSSPVLLKCNNCYRSDTNDHFYVSPSNTTGELTIRLYSKVRDTSDHSEYAGFHVTLSCGMPCEYITSTIDSVFDRTDLKTGAIVGHGTMKYIPAALDTIFEYRYDTIGIETVYDTVWTDSIVYQLVPRDSLVIDTIQLDSIISIDTLGMVWAALLCQGQGVIFHGHGNYTYNTGYTFPTDSTTMFTWMIGSDVITGKNKTRCEYNGFQEPGCPDVTLKLTYEETCLSRLNASIQVRVSPNPIKTIFDLSSICNNDSLMVNVGYDGDNGTLTLKEIQFATTVSKVNEVRTFIPDGPYCPIPCYEAPVDFTGEFAPGKVVKSASEICSICINYEHTYMGDYRVAIRCPIYDENISNTVGQAILKYGKNGGCPTCDPLAPDDSPDGSFAGSSTDCGWAPHVDNNPQCDSLFNPFGIGLDYCWSRNENYTLVTGDPADLPTRFQPGNWYISYTGTGAYTISESALVIPQCPSYFQRNNLTNPGYYQTRMPSNYEEKTDYYSPSSDFSELIGCPLTGMWNAVICDFWGGDNGWIFNWSLDICGSVSAGDCTYKVGIDSVVWHPDTNYATDFRDGLYRGIHINKKWNDTTAAYISSPDTSGDFRIKLSIYDEFGCQWDTATHISTVHTPRPNLGNDTVLCSVNSIELDAGDSFADNFDFSYIWEPYGDSTRIIETRTGSYDDKTYIVEVSNAEKNIECSARDTIVVTINPQPVPNFDPGIYPLEGCEPFTINIVNTTTNGYKYQWVFGDGTYSTLKNPSHSYAAGSYDFKYYVESEKGCKDSLIYTNLINVYSAPKAAFSWDPVFPTVLHPSISLINNTAPDNGSNRYFWEIQYDKDIPYSFHTLTDNNPTWEWTARNGEDVSGNYVIRLIARAEEYAPSGRLIQCADTVENTILLINDDIKFPNVVTPNGDGINDRFVIYNLVEGLAYPINQLDIYDKWGSRIFHAVNIQKDDQFWDPAKTNTPAGTYFYRFSGKGYKGNLEHNGVIEVIK